MTTKRLLGLTTALAICASAHAFASVVIAVPGTGDLYLSGRPAGTQCCDYDSAPAESPVLASIALTAGEILTVSATGGAAHQPGPLYPTPDGATDQLYSLHADYGTGISGPTDIHLGALAGVFLGAGTPSGPAPAQLTGADFASIAPGLDQIFFIGDGLTGTGAGAVQTFVVPTGATRLFLGITDDGGYYDNSGEITATLTPISAAPEPSVWALLLAGVATVGMALRRRARRIGGLSPTS